MVHLTSRQTLLLRNLSDSPGMQDVAALLRVTACCGGHQEHFTCARLFPLWDQCLWVLELFCASFWQLLSALFCSWETAQELLGTARLGKWCVKNSLGFPGVFKPEKGSGPKVRVARRHRF